MRKIQRRFTLLQVSHSIEMGREGEGVRIDSGYEEGNNVTPFYDPMISKCIIKGNDRPDALKRRRDSLKG